MKISKIFPIFFVLCLIAALCPVPALALEQPKVESRAAIVMDRNTGEVYFSSNADMRVYPASTTKIMTVLLAVEAVESGSAALSDEVTANPGFDFDLTADSTTAGIVEGETMTLESLLYCAMLASANEACNIIAEYIGGSISAFISMMNLRAVELGCEATRFANTHGLSDNNHYTTAADFSKIAMEAASHDVFMRLCTAESVDIPATNVSGVRHLTTSNALMTEASSYGSAYYYPYAAGMKTGYTHDAGYCLVSTAAKDEIELLAAVFGGQVYASENGRSVYTNFSDSIALYDWVFDNFSYQEVLDPTQNVASVDVNLGKDSDYVNLRPAGAVSLLLPNDYDPTEFKLDLQVYSLEQGKIVTAPVTSGEVLGEVSVLRNGQNCGTVKLVAASSVDLSRSQYIQSHVEETTHTGTFRLLLWGTILILLVYIAWVVYYRMKRVNYVRAADAALAAAAAGDAMEKSAEPEIEFFTGTQRKPRPVEKEAAPKTVPATPAASSAPPSPEPETPQRPRLLMAEPHPVETKAPAAPAAPTVPEPPSAPEQAPTAETRADAEENAPAEPLSLFRNKADREYFEEFFKGK